MRRRLLERLKSLLVYTSVTVLVLLAVSATLLRLAVAYAPELRAEAEAYLGQWLQREVSIGGLRARWQGLDPRLIFEDVVVRGEGSTRYSFDELELAISARTLFTEARLVPSEVVLQGMDLTVERLPTGVLELSADRAPPFLAELPARIRVEDAVVRVVDHVRADVYAMTDAQLVYARSDGSSRLVVLAELPAFIGERAEFVLHWSDADRPFEDARLYADLSGVRFDALQGLGAGLAALPGLRGGGDVELWLEADGGRVSAATGRVSLSRLSAEGGVSRDWLDIGRRLEARFDWRRLADGWALDVDEIGYAVDQRLWPTSGLSVRYRRQTASAPERWRAGVEYIELSRLRQLLAHLPQVPDGLREWAGQVELGGELRQAGAQLQRRDGRVVSYALKGTLSGGRFISADGDYAVSGLDVSFTANERGGEARVIGRDGELRLARLFRRGLSYQDLEAEVAWARATDGWRVGMSGVRLRNADAAVDGSARLFDLGSGNPFIDLWASAQRFDAAAVSRYLPVGIMADDLVGWLDQALLGGQVHGAEMLFHGRARDFPFRDGVSGVFEVSGQVSDAGLRFLPEWPVIEAVDASLRFTGTGMWINAGAGQILGADIRRAEARIESFREARLQVEGDLAGPGDSYLEFLRRAPISRGLAPQLRPLRLGGRHALYLRLDLPLKTIQRSRVNGLLRLTDGRFGVAGSGFELAALNGPVRFDERGVRSEGLTARWRDRPVDLTVSTEGAGAAERILVSAALTAGVETLLPRLDALTTGRARWQVQARLPAFRSGVRMSALPVSVSSDLVGLGVRLPRPLGKSTATPRPLEARFRISAAGRSAVDVDYGELARVRVAAPGDGQASAGRYGVRLGPGVPQLPEGEGLRITGRLPRLEMDDLSALVAAGGSGGGGWPTTWLDVSVGRLVVAGQHLREQTVVGSLRPQMISLRLTGPDLAGDVDAPLDGSAVGRVDLRWLRLSKPGDAQPAGSERPGEAPVLPAGILPSLDLDIAELYLDDRALGRFTAVLKAERIQTRLKRFRLASEDIIIEGSGGWHHGPAAERSWLAARFDSDDVGEALERFGYARTVKGGKSEGRMHLAWPGGPLAISPATVDGELEFSLRDGRLPAVEPGAGRMFGLLSLATVPRRLTLDFSDIFQEGFSFDEIKARFLLERGVAEPRIFFIEGPAARIDFAGEIDLVDQRFDQVMTVTPQVSSTLPLIGGLTGGPVAAVVLFVTQQIFQDQMDSIAQYRYRVTGPWQDPRIEPIRRPPPQDFEAFPGDG